MEDAKEVREEVKVGQNERVNRSVAQNLWRLFMAGSIASPLAVNVAERGYSYLFSDVKLAQRVNDVDAFLSLFGRRLETFRSREAEEKLGLARANILNLSEKYEIEIDWDKIAGLPQIERLRGSSLVLMITDDILPIPKEEEELLREEALKEGHPEAEFLRFGLAGEIGGTRMIFPGIDDFVVVITTLSQSHEEIPIEAKSEIISTALVHEIAHLIDYRRQATLIRMLGAIKDPEAHAKKEEEFANSYTEENKNIWAGAVTARPIQEPIALSKEELDQVNNILVGLQVEARLGSLEPAKPYWKKGIEV